MLVGLGVNLYILVDIISIYVVDYFSVVIILHDSTLQCKRDINLCHEPCKKVDERMDFYSRVHTAQTGVFAAVNAKADGATWKIFTLL